MICSEALDLDLMAEELGFAYPPELQPEMARRWPEFLPEKRYGVPGGFRRRRGHGKRLRVTANSRETLACTPASRNSSATRTEEIHAPASFGDTGATDPATKTDEKTLRE